MKNGIFALLLIAFGPALFAQQTEKGDIMIDAYYGGPNFGKIFAEAFPLVKNKTITGAGPFGVRGEYMLSDKIGVGFDYIYNSFTVSGVIDSLNIDNSHYQTFDYSIRMNRHRFHIRTNFHVVRNERTDGYIGFGIGSNTRSYAVDTQMTSRKDYKGTVTFVPIGVRLAFGLRYYPIRNLGLHGELGIGGPLLSGGLSIRI